MRKIWIWTELDFANSIWARPGSIVTQTFRVSEPRLARLFTIATCAIIARGTLFTFTVEA